jgi:hypothetical protein
MENQDQRFLDAIAHSPSLAILVLEGIFEKVQLSTKTLHNSSRPIAGTKLKNSRIKVKGKQATCMPKSCKDSWVVEMTIQGKGGKLDWNILAEQFVAITKNEIAGAVIPIPNNSRNIEAWASAWKQASAKLEIPQLEPSPKRSSSIVEVENGQPLVPVILEVQNLSDRGQIASPVGKSTFRIWHQGSVELSQKNDSVKFTIIPGEWENFKHNGKKNTFQLYSP